MFEKAFCVRRRKCCLSCGCGGYFAQLPSHTALSSAPSRPPTTLGSTLALCETPPQPCLGKQRRPPSRTLLVAPRPRPLLARKHGAQQKSADNTVSHTALALLSLLLQALWHSGHALNGRSRRTTHTTATLTPTPTSDAICYYPRDFAARTRKPSAATVTTMATATTTAPECPTVTATMNCLLQQAHRMPTSAARHQHDDENNNDKDDETGCRRDTSAASAHASAATGAALLAFVQAAAAAVRTPPGPTANECGSVGSARHAAPRGGGQPVRLG